MALKRLDELITTLVTGTTQTIVEGDRDNYQYLVGVIDSDENLTVYIDQGEGGNYIKSDSFTLTAGTAEEFRFALSCPRYRIRLGNASGSLATPDFMANLESEEG